MFTFVSGSFAQHYAMNLIHGVAFRSGFFYYYVNTSLFIYIHSTVVGLLDCFQVLPITNNSTVNILLHAF